MVVSLSLLADAAAALRPDVPTDPIVVGTSTPPHRSRKRAVTFAEGVIIDQSKRQFFSPTTTAAAPTESIAVESINTITSPIARPVITETTTTNAAAPTVDPTAAAEDTLAR